MLKKQIVEDTYDRFFVPIWFKTNLTVWYDGVEGSQTAGRYVRMLKYGIEHHQRIAQAREIASNPF